MSKLCSLIFPTYKRVESLRRTIQSLMGTAEDFDVWLYVHDDETKKIIPELSSLVDLHVVEGPDLDGYASCPLFVHQLGDACGSPWRWLWADDVLMEGRGWDKQLAQVPQNKNFIAFAEVHKLASPPHNVTNTISGYAYTFPIMPQSFDIPTVGSIDGAINEIYIPNHGWRPWILRGIGANHQNTAPCWQNRC